MCSNAWGMRWLRLRSSWVLSPDLGLGTEPAPKPTESEKPFSIRWRGSPSQLQRTALCRRMYCRRVEGFVFSRPHKFAGNSRVSTPHPLRHGCGYCFRDHFGSTTAISRSTWECFPQNNSQSCSNSRWPAQRLEFRRIQSGFPHTNTCYSGQSPERLVQLPSRMASL